MLAARLAGESSNTGGQVSSRDGATFLIHSLTTHDMSAEDRLNTCKYSLSLSTLHILAPYLSHTLYTLYIVYIIMPLYVLKWR